MGRPPPPKQQRCLLQTNPKVVRKVPEQEEAATLASLLLSSLSSSLSLPVQSCTSKSLAAVAAALLQPAVLSASRTQCTTMPRARPTQPTLKLAVPRPSRATWTSLLAAAVAAAAAAVPGTWTFHQTLAAAAALDTWTWRQTQAAAADPPDTWMLAAPKTAATWTAPTEKKTSKACSLFAFTASVILLNCDLLPSRSKRSSER